MSEFSQTLRDGLTLRATDSATSPVLEQFFEGYDRAFVLPDEREELAGFRRCLELNETDLATAYGRRHRELVLVIQDGSGVRLGGANFLSTRMNSDPGEPATSVNLNYLYVEHSARGRGLSRLLVHAVHRLANEVHGVPESALPPAVFIEQNDPFRLTPEEYAADTAHSGTDQLDRLSIWARLGARVVDFEYIQPALAPDRAPDDGLIYAALAYPADEVSSRFFHDHLQSFFGVSVLKGAAPDTDPAVRAQLRELKERTTPIRLRSLSAALTQLSLETPKPRPTSFLEFMRQRDL